MRDIETRIKQVISDHLLIDMEKITLSSSFQDLGADSLDSIQLMMGIEQEFSLSIPDKDMDDIGTVEQTTAYIKKRMECEQS